MTNKQIIKKIAKKQMALIAIRREIADLKAQIIQNEYNKCGFKYGDKVCITFKDNTCDNKKGDKVIAFFYSIDFLNEYDLSITHMKFTKPNKNGSMSSVFQFAPSWAIGKIEKI